MLALNGKPLVFQKFPDGTPLFKCECEGDTATITWFYENSDEVTNLVYLTRHLKDHGVDDITLIMPYTPNARQDRVKNPEDVFTLKYFAEIINFLNFREVLVLDPHSNVTLALLERVREMPVRYYIGEAIMRASLLAEDDDLVLFYPDEGAMKRYSGMIKRPYTFGIKKRNWETGVIEGLDVFGDSAFVKDRNILIVDDICSRGGTFYHSAKKLRELGAKKIFLYVTHCENTIREGELLKTDYIERIYTTNSIYTQKDEENTKVEVFKL